MRAAPLLVLILAIAAGLGGYWAYQHWNTPEPVPLPAAAPSPDNIIGLRRPDFSLPDLDGQLRRIAEWDGKVLVVNFWATWCPPCRREIPAFIELQETYGPQGLQFVGVAVDTPDNVSDFVDPLGINYPTLVGEADAIAIAKEYGNRLGVLPYTVVIDRQGSVVYVHRNELSHADAEAVIQPLL